ncbi:hypothetical protein ACLOJK_022209 [Asimina triloba]
MDTVCSREDRCSNVVVVQTEECMPHEAAGRTAKAAVGRNVAVELPDLGKGVDAAVRIPSDVGWLDGHDQTDGVNSGCWILGYRSMLLDLAVDSPSSESEGDAVVASLFSCRSAMVVTNEDGFLAIDLAVDCGYCLEETKMLPWFSWSDLSDLMAAMVGIQSPAPLKKKGRRDRRHCH